MELNDFKKNTAFSQTYVRIIGGIFFLGSYFHRKHSQEHGWFSAHFVGKLFLLLRSFGLFLQRNLLRKKISVIEGFMKTSSLSRWQKCLSVLLGL